MSIFQYASEYEFIQACADDGGSIIEAIKAFRTEYGSGLGEAKQIVSAHPAYIFVARLADETLHADAEKMMNKDADTDTSADIFSATCDVTFDPADHGLQVKADGRVRGLWFYTGEPNENWDNGKCRPALIDWDNLRRLQVLIESELRRSTLER